MKSRRSQVGRFSVEFDVASNEDAVKAKAGLLSQAKVRSLHLTGVVDTGATRLVLPLSVVTALGLPDTGSVAVRFADGRREERRIAGQVLVEILGRASVFTAVVGPGRTDALIGAFVLEELDLIPDPTRQALVPRDPRGIFAEIDCHLTAALPQGPGANAESCPKVLPSSK